MIIINNQRIGYKNVAFIYYDNFSRLSVISDQWKFRETFSMKKYKDFDQVTS